MPTYTHTNQTKTVSIVGFEENCGLSDKKCSISPLLEELEQFKAVDSILGICRYCHIYFVCKKSDYCSCNLVVKGQKCLKCENLSVKTSYDSIISGKYGRSS